MNIKIYREDGLDGRARQPMSAAVVEYCQMVMMSKQFSQAPFIPGS